MNAKLLTLLLVLGVAAGGAVYWFVLGPAETVDADPAEAALLVPELAERADEVARITITSNDGRLVLERDGDDWRLPARGGFAAERDTVRALTFAVAALEKAEAKTANPAYHDRLGLSVPEPDADEPESPVFGTPAPTRVTIEDASGGVIADVIVGDVSYRGRQEFVFVRRADADQSWQSPGRVEAPINAESWYDRGVVRADRESVASVRVEPADGPAYEVVRQTPGDADTGDAAAPPPDRFTLAEIPEGRTLRTPTAANSVAGALAFLSVRGVRLAEQSAADVTTDRSVYALETGTTITLRRLVEDATWVLIEVEPADGDEDAALLRTRTDGYAFELDETALSNIFKPLEGLLSEAPAEPDEAEDPIPDALAPLGPESDG